MPNGKIKQIKTPDNTVYDIVDDKAYHVDDTTNTTINDTDFVPLSTSSSAKKKSTFSNLVEKIKTKIGRLSAQSGGTDLTLVNTGDMYTWNNKAETSDITTAIQALDGSVTGTPGKGKTLTTFSETDGVVTAKFENISITKSQVSDMPTNLSQFTNDSGFATETYVTTAIDELPEPMIFKGSLGTGGTITTLPTASSSNKGYTYKVITAGTYASQSAKVGDTFISDGTTWVLIPSGDEPSGTVTSITIKATSPIAVNNSGAITTSGTRTISHEDSGVSEGTYKSVTVNAKGHVTAGTNPTTLSEYGITDAAVAEIRLTNEDLNDVTTVGFYYAGGGNTVTNKPTGYNNFGLVVVHNASGSQYTQIISNENGSHRRIKKSNGTWTNWTEDKFTDTTYSFVEGTNQFTVTPSSGSASTIKVTPQLKIDGITSDTTDKEINCYGECSTAAGTAAKTVSITKGTFALAAGSKVIVKFTNANTANNPTLNVNSKGAKNIFHNGARITTETNKALLAGTIEFVYDGTQFQLVGNYIDTDTTYSAGTGISFDGTTINHSNSVTAGTAKGDNSKTLTFGGTFTIPSVTYDAQGHVTAKGTTTMTMPSNPNTDTTYTFTGGTDKFTVTPSGGSAQTVNVANGGVRSIATGSTFGTYSVNTGGTSADKSINLTGDFQASGQNLNDIKTSGVYYFSSGNVPTNVPAGSNGILIVTAAHISSTTGLFVKQVWMRHGTNDLSDNTKAAYYSSNDQETYVRTYNNSTWSSWHKLFASTVNGNNYRANLQVSKNDGRNGQRTWTNLYVGNSTGIGTADLYVHDTDATKNRNGSQCGRIYMYNGTTTGTSNYATVLTPAANTGERTITFPNDSGTVALTKNINVVAQTDSSMSSSYNKYYRVLFSNSDNDTTENAGTRKCSQVLINPYDGSLRAGFLEIAPDVDNAILSMSNVNFAKANIKVPTTPTADYDIYLPPVGGMLALASSWTCENSSGHTGTTAFTTNILDTVSEIFLKVQLGEASNKIFIPIHIPVTTISATNDSVERWRGGYYQSSTAGGEVSYWIWKKDGYIKMHLDIAYLNGSSVASSTKVYVYYKTY